MYIQVVSTVILDNWRRGWTKNFKAFVLEVYKFKKGRGVVLLRVQISSVLDLIALTISFAEVY